MLGLFIVPGLAGTITSVATIRTMRGMLETEIEFGAERLSRRAERLAIRVAGGRSIYAEKKFSIAARMRSAAWPSP
jgi:hypothetical protein